MILYYQRLLKHSKKEEEKMKGKYIIPVLCLTLLCGCTEQNTTVAEVTPTPEVTATPEIRGNQEKRADITVDYKGYEKLVGYSFKMAPAIDEASIVFADGKTKEEQVFDVCSGCFEKIKAELDSIDVLYIRFDELYVSDVYEDARLYEKPVHLDAILDDKEIIDEWKSLVKDASLKLNGTYKYGDTEKYTGETTTIIFCAANSGEVKELFSNQGNYYCNSPAPVTSFKFSSEEKKKQFENLIVKIGRLAVEKCDKALAEPGNYPYLTN